MYTCFIVCPIGEPGSQIRQDADDLRDLIIKPALAYNNIEIYRGDDDITKLTIDSAVIDAIQHSDLCLVDVSLMNPNVYYELGRRDETNKPVILLRSKTARDELAADIRNRRFVDYDLSNREGIRNSIFELQRAVKPYIDTEFLYVDKNEEEKLNIAESLHRIESILKNITGSTTRETTQPMTALACSAPTNSDSASTQELFMQALLTGNIPMMESCMDRLEYQMDRMKFLDTIVKAAAAKGSVKAGELLIENASEFIDSSMSFHSKVQYLGCLVSNLNRTDKEEDNIELVEEMCRRLEEISEGESPSDCVQVYNQLNRLYHGIYGNTEDKKWLNKSINALEKALTLSEQENFLHYNLAICLKNRNEGSDMVQARDHILRCLELSEDSVDPDHLEEACEIFHELNDPRFDDYMEQLEALSPTKANLLRFRLR